MNTISSRLNSQTGTESLSNKAQVSEKGADSPAAGAFGADSVEISSGTQSSDDDMLVQSIGIGGIKISFDPAVPLSPKEMNRILQDIWKLQNLQ